MATALRRTGLGVVGDMPWGAHFCLFYETRQDFLDTLVSYFKAGLESNEFCLWVLSKSDQVTKEEAWSALRLAVPNLPQRAAAERIESSKDSHNQAACHLPPPLAQAVLPCVEMPSPATRRIGIVVVIAASALGVSSKAWAAEHGEAAPAPSASEPQSRTEWAERQAEELLSVPFIAEFVLRSPQMIDGTQKEVADLLILYKGSGLLVSQKAQEDPLSRDERKNELWVLKAAKNGLRQLVGALRGWNGANCEWRPIRFR